MKRAPPLDLSQPYVTADLEGIGGKIRARTEDFVVEEVSLYDPTGEGDHLYVNVTKKNMTTREVQSQIADLFDLRPQNIGTAGLKDKKAVATQTFSILLEKNDVSAEDAVKRIERKIDVRVNWAKFHNNKFRAGHLVGNRFTVTISDIRIPKGKALERANLIAEQIYLRGMPNYYGDQRIGRGGKNIQEGWAILNGHKHFKDRWLSKLLVAGYQSYLCNRNIAERVRRGLFDKLLLGDIVKKHMTGGIFWVNDLAVDQPRFDSKEISFTAPIFGYKMSHPLGESAVLEAEIFEESEMSMKTFKRMKITGTRRFGRLTPEIEVTRNQRGIQIDFMLHKGGYATTLLREFMKT
jgi:tRNA pseudouridine13 synthase